MQPNPDKNKFSARTRDFSSSWRRKEELPAHAAPIANGFNMNAVKDLPLFTEYFWNPGTRLDAETLGEAERRPPEPTNSKAISQYFEETFKRLPQHRRTLGNAVKLLFVLWDERRQIRLKPYSPQTINALPYLVKHAILSADSSVSLNKAATILDKISLLNKAGLLDEHRDTYSEVLPILLNCVGQSLPKGSPISHDDERAAATTLRALGRLAKSELRFETDSLRQQLPYLLACVAESPPFFKSAFTMIESLKGLNDCLAAPPEQDLDVKHSSEWVPPVKNYRTSVSIIILKFGPLQHRITSEQDFLRNHLEFFTELAGLPAALVDSDATLKQQIVDFITIEQKHIFKALSNISTKKSAPSFQESREISQFILILSRLAKRDLLKPDEWATEHRAALMDLLNLTRALTFNAIERKQLSRGLMTLQQLGFVSADLYQENNQPLLPLRTLRLHSLTPPPKKSSRNEPS